MYCLDLHAYLRLECFMLYKSFYIQVSNTQYMILKFYSRLQVDNFVSAGILDRFIGQVCLSYVLYQLMFDFNI